MTVNRRAHVEQAGPRQQEVVVAPRMLETSIRKPVIGWSSRATAREGAAEEGLLDPRGARVDVDPPGLQQ
ncbi:hypothetical protein ACIGXM_21310 [Kitasatospora sp. NPDC052896]|uniref:hypothetical protein n=1 Tax=Kitasatospora sp. NPDC052896 TaxID=3364061 RepID=UPI0037C9DB96